MLWLASVNFDTARIEARFKVWTRPRRHLAEAHLREPLEVPESGPNLRRITSITAAETLITYDTVSYSKLANPHIFRRNLSFVREELCQLWLIMTGGALRSPLENSVCRPPEPSALGS